LWQVRTTYMRGSINHERLSFSVATKMLKGIEWESTWDGRRGTLASVLCPRCDHVSNIRTQSKVLHCANCAARLRRPKSAPQRRTKAKRRSPRKPPSKIKRMSRAVRNITQIRFPSFARRARNHRTFRTKLSERLA
jgi:ribosomal protein L37AE/L43A